MSKAKAATSRSGRVAVVGHDLVALGPMAPVRAMYEVAKRSGAHGALLRRFVAGASIRPLSPVSGLGMPQAVPSVARARSLRDAQLIVNQGHRVFGKRFPVERPEDWISLPGTGLSWPREKFWWDIDIRTDERLGDVKWTWELGRHRDLVVLARAAALEPEGPWLDALEERLRGWFEISQPEVGIHWYSNLEIALRVIAWMQIFSLVHDRLDPALIAIMADHVGRAERHLMFDFPYTASSMRNNHLLGDALGLIAIDRFTGGDGSRRPARLAERFFRAQLTRHMRTDGSMIEDSLSYHRFVMEMLVIKRILGDEGEALTEALRGSAAHLVHQGALEGALPQWGDWDEGRVLASSGDPLDVQGSVRLSLYLGGMSTRNDADEVVWYAGQEVQGQDPLPASGGISGGIAHIRRGPWRVWFKVGLQRSHQHADLGHVSIEYDGRWMVVDPGTGTYNGPLGIRNGFRTSSAHNGIRVEGREILTPHRAFRWIGDPGAVYSEPLHLTQCDVVLGAHNAFVNGGQGWIARAVVVCENGVTCIDWTDAPADTLTTLALAPDLDRAADSQASRTAQLCGVEGATEVRGSEQPFGGWHSPTYGTWQPATWLTMRNVGGSVSWWSTADHKSITPVAQGRRVSMGNLCLSLTFADNEIELEVSDAHGKRVLRMKKEGNR